jgi:cytidylate kinase
MAQQTIAATQAEALVKESDRVRATFVEEFCKASWEACSAFDLVINTGKISPDLAVAWIIKAMSDLEKRADSEATTATIQVDSILASAVSDELGCQLAHQGS